MMKLKEKVHLDSKLSCKSCQNIHMSETKFSLIKTASIRNLLLELHCPLKRATVVYCDNISVVYMSHNPV